MMLGRGARIPFVSLVACLFGATSLRAEIVCIPGEYLAVVKESAQGGVSAAKRGDSVITALGEATVVREFKNVGRNGARVFHLVVPQSASPESIRAASTEDFKLSPNCLNSINDGSIALAQGAQLETIMQPMGLGGPSLPPETYAGVLWGLDNIGQDGGVNDVDVDAPEAWQITKGDPSLVVAVIDSGVDYNHPDLASNMWQNPGEIPGNGFDDDNNGFVDDVFGADTIDLDGDPRPAPISEPLNAVMVGRGHGTHVAGTIAAVENGLGVVGVAPQVKIMAVRVLGPEGFGSDAQILAGIDYVLEMRRRGVNVRVANASLGGAQACPNAYVQTLAALGDAGVVFVASAGNGGQDGKGDNIDRTLISPAGCPNPNVVSVANISRVGQLSPSSNYGPKGVDVAGPGTEVLSTFPPQHLIFLNGTSMAAPHVAGVAALLLSSEPALSANEARLRLMETVKPLPALSGLINAPGIVSASRALNAQKTFDLTVAYESTSSSAKASSGRIALKLSAKLFDPSARVRGGFVEVIVGKKKYKGRLRAKSLAGGTSSVQASGSVPYPGGKVSARFFVELSDGTLLVSPFKALKVVGGGKAPQQRTPKQKVNFSGLWSGDFRLTSTTCGSASPGFHFIHRVTQRGTKVTLVEQSEGGLTFAGALNKNGFSASARSNLNGCEVTSTMQYGALRGGSSNVSAVVRLNCGIVGACQAEYRGGARR